MTVPPPFPASGPVSQAFMGTAEVAGFLGVTKQYVSQLARRPGFPGAAARLASGPVWVTDEVTAWHRAREQSKG